MPRPSPNQGTLQLPNIDDDDFIVIANGGTGTRNDRVQRLSI